MKFLHHRRSLGPPIKVRRASLNMIDSFSTIDDRGSRATLLVVFVVVEAWGQYHQRVYTQLLHAQILKAQKAA